MDGCTIPGCPELPSAEVRVGCVSILRVRRKKSRTDPEDAPLEYILWNLLNHLQKGPGKEND